MFKIEVTDTFGGEANYCWVKRGTTKATSRRGLIKAIKDVAGWTDWCRVRVVYNDGDSIEVRPTATSDVCQVAFAHWVD
jgi:hypothetical protein